jgi:hypothetical protein
MMTIKEIFSILDAEGCSPSMRKSGEEEFSRVIEFQAAGVTCFIEWWSNIAYLSIGSRYGSCFGFDKVRVNTSWPSFLRGLSFSLGADKNARMLIATKLLDWQKEG